MTGTLTLARPINRSNEELAMRALIVPELRKRWPGARIIHELPTRYSTNRIDLAAVTPDRIISVEIKSSRDVSDRLEAQLHAFAPVSHQTIVCLAPKWLERPPVLQKPNKFGGVSFITQCSEVEQIIQRVRNGREGIRTWSVDAGAGTIEPDYESRIISRPWTARLLDLLHVAELREIASRKRCAVVHPRSRHDELLGGCFDTLTSREIVAETCRALRARDAFGAESDPPIVGESA